MDGPAITFLAAAFGVVACSAPSADAGVDGSALDLGVADLGVGDRGASEGGASDGSTDLAVVSDLAKPDGGALPDLGPVQVGAPCDPVRGCTGGLSCQPQIAPPVRPLYDCSDGGVEIDAGAVSMTGGGPLYMEGYCTNAAIGDPRSVEGAPGACNPALASDDPGMAGMDGCDPSAKCVELTFAPPMSGDPPYVQCLLRCTGPSDCRGGYRCTKAGTCDPFGCHFDLECRVVFEGGFECLDPAHATSICNTLTGSCT